MALQFEIRDLAIGDQISVTALPEAYLAQKGERLFYSDERIWAFKHNPYIDFRKASVADTSVLIEPAARWKWQAERYSNRYNVDVIGSQTEFILSELGLARGCIRHPRLYVHEDLNILPHKVVVHTTGSSRELHGENQPIRFHLGEDAIRTMSDEVISVIVKNYKDWLIVQIGGADDKPIDARNVVDLRGKLDVWESAREIATASRFIGVNSGPMHIANCYPRVSKRIVLMEFSRGYFEKEDGMTFPWRAGSISNYLTTWLDPANTYFNRFEDDLGSSFSFLKI